MPNVYSYTYSSEGHGPWWGIRCPREFYDNAIRQMHETSRCFVYLTNSMGETLVVAVEGPHPDGDDNIFVPDWVLTRLGIEVGEEVVVDPILEPLPKGESVVLRPMTGSTVEGPMFLEGLTEALNQLGVVQEGVLSAIVDPSMPQIHEFFVENLLPAKVCLADGELRVDLQRAMDRPPTPIPPEIPRLLAEPVNDFHDICECEMPVAPLSSNGFVPFSGKGYRLDGK